MSSPDSSSVSSFCEQSSTTNSERGSTNGFSTTSGSSNLSKEQQEELAAKETRAVRRSRAAFVAVLAVSAVIGGVITYFFSSKEEMNEFEMEFYDFASEIADVSQHKAHTAHGVIEGFGVTTTSFSEFTNTGWPNFTLPHYDLRAHRFMYTTGVDLLALSPVITEETRALWEAYSVDNQGWIAESLGVKEEDIPLNIPNKIHSSPDSDEEDVYYVPLWQTSPMTEDTSFVNFDLLSHPTFHRIFKYVMEKKEPVLSEALDITALFGPHAPNSSGHPQSLMVQPVFKTFDEHAKEVVAILIAVVPWDIYFTNLLHDGAEGIFAVLEDSCGDEFSYEINGPGAHYLGEGDLHDRKYDDLVFIAEFEPFPWHTAEDNSNSANCHYDFRLYPTHKLEDQYNTSKPALLTFAVIMVFAVTTSAFAIYDCLVQRRQDKVMDSAMRSNAIVSSLFPAEVRDRLFNNSKRKDKKRAKDDRKMGGLLPSLTEAPKFRLNNFLSEDEKKHQPSEPNTLGLESKPIADLFPNATVMFGDIAGFTAWSSVRQPSEVFTLLETIFRAFDHVAKRRQVFKVETIGDSYVAVTGLPEPRQDHAVLMARFSRDCLQKMKELTTKLEVTLGPDTGDLTMRFGLHSGPVTAGVLRGEKSRFQLFGDTVNTAARMESTGENNRIQLSEQTASKLREAGKEHWFEAREDKVHAKGKGELQTYWLYPKEKNRKVDCSHGDTTEHGEDRSVSEGHEDGRKEMFRTKQYQDYAVSAKTERMVGWSVDVLLRLLKQVVAARIALPPTADENEDIAKLETTIGRDMTVQEEVTEFVTLPKFDKDFAEKMQDPEKIELKPQVIEQLRLFVTAIATMYRDNPFHNFEHASHVTMSVSKLLSRIVAADVAPGEKNHGQGKILLHMHDRTYGITSDPLTQFAVVFSALIHDVDHRGLPNFLLIKEDPELAATYKNRSVAEQNSVYLAWNRLTEPEFDELRSCIYATTSELKRFRQTVVNTVMATDIFDEEFAELRKRRWDRCFHTTHQEQWTPADDINRRAAIVIEHLIQASDVAHTMQHWQIYQKWNERLFAEMYTAFLDGRSQKDPSENWYVGEIGFFDNYIIPLAKKLQECEVFGVSSHEYLNYALENRNEWSNRGNDVVARGVASLSGQNKKTSQD